MSYANAVALNGVANVLDRGINTMWRFADREDRLKREAKDDELRSVQLEAAKTGLEKTRKDMRDKERAAKLQAAIVSGDFNSLDPDDAAEVDKYIQQVAPAAAERVAAAKLTLPVVRGAKQRFEQYRQQVQQAGGRTPQGAQEFFSMASDPGFGEFAPALGKALFASDRFDKSHKKTVGGKEYEYFIDKNNPIADMNVHLPTGKVVAHLRAVDKDGNDITNIVKPVATEQQGTGDDELVVTRTPEELEQYISRVAADGERVLKLRNAMAQKKLIEVSPEAQSSLARGLSEQVVNDVKWKDTEKNSKDLFAGSHGPQIKEIFDFYKIAGVAPDKALPEILKAKQEFRKLEKDDAAGKQATSLLGAMLRSKPEQFGALFEQHSESISPAAMTKAIDSFAKIRGVEDKDKRSELYGLIAQASMLRAQKAGSSGGDDMRERRLNITERNAEIGRIRTHTNMLNRQLDAAKDSLYSDGLTDKDRVNINKDIAKIKAQIEQNTAALEQMGNRATPTAPLQQPQAAGSSATMQGLTGDTSGRPARQQVVQKLTVPLNGDDPQVGKLRDGTPVYRDRMGATYAMRGKQRVEVR